MLVASVVSLYFSLWVAFFLLHVCLSLNWCVVVLNLSDSSLKSVLSCSLRLWGCSQLSWVHVFPCWLSRVLDTWVCVSGLNCKERKQWWSVSSSHLFISWYLVSCLWSVSEVIVAVVCFTAFLCRTSWWRITCMWWYMIYLLLTLEVKYQHVVLYFSIWALCELLSAPLMF